MTARDSSPRRRLAFAGTWYSGDPVRLAADVDAWLADAPAIPGTRAIVSPHAGLRYSGRVAAQAYGALGRERRDAVILIGPSHHVAFPGCAMFPRGAVDSPWQPHPVAVDLVDALKSSSNLITCAGADVHTAEHSLEMQLPFLARVLPGVPVVLILMGKQTRGVAFTLGDAIAKATAGRDVAIVASSDLSHYHDAATATRMDRQVLDALDARSPDTLMALLEKEPHHACGGGPMVAVLRAMARSGPVGGGVLAYADSGDVTGDKSSVVGYAAAAFGAPMEAGLSPAAR
jgi:AmmeMemoRadiSam system protein B